MRYGQVGGNHLHRHWIGHERRRIDSIPKYINHIMHFHVRNFLTLTVSPGHSWMERSQEGHMETLTFLLWDMLNEMKDKNEKLLKVLIFFVSGLWKSIKYVND